MKLNHLHRLRWLFIGEPRQWEIWRPVAIALPIVVLVLVPLVWILERL